MFRTAIALALRAPFGVLSSLLLLFAPAVLFACGATDRQTSSDSALDSVTQEAFSAEYSPVLPSPTLAVPEGNRLAFLFDAEGVQIYVCKTMATAFAWTLQAPEATLGDHRAGVVGRHYAGPTWEYLDGSKVVGNKTASFTADPTAIPELLLQASSHAGSGRMAQVTYIQRLATKGGLAPASGCDAAHAGTTVRIDYTATYYFYRLSKDNRKP